MSVPALQNVESLKQAFQTFNEISQNLTQSYLDLEAQVARLTHELSAARSERLKTLIEKEQLANRLQHLLEALPGGVIVVDGQGLIVDFNPGAERLLGKLTPFLHWREALDRVSLSDDDNPHQRRLVNGLTVTVSLRSLGPDAGQIILLTDISEQRALQEWVNQQKRLSALGEMVAILAHQVRTPLAAALLYATHLGREDLRPEQRERFGAHLVERLQHLERQINDLLAFARVGRLVMERVEVGELLRQLEETINPTLHGKPIRLDIDDQAPNAALFGNPDALLGILTNLLGNAVEALRTRGGRIGLNVRRTGAGWLGIEVTDDGPGIAPDVLPHIFEAFYTTRTDGTGLGLAIVDSVVRAHGGRVSCRSTPGAGACFRIDLPLQPVPNMLPSGYSGRKNPLGESPHEC